MESTDIRNEALKSVPAVGVSSATYFGFTLADWMYVVTILYILMQMVMLGYKIFSVIFKSNKRGK